MIARQVDDSVCNLKEMYKLYDEDIKTQIEETESSIKNISSSRDVLLDVKLAPHKDKLIALFGADFAKVDNIRTYSRITFNDRVKRYVYFLFKANNDLKKLKTKLTELNASKLTYKEYSYILREYNQASIEYMLNGGNFHLEHKCGLIRVKKVENVTDRKRVNWGKSNQIKASLIAQGKTPYKSIKDEDGNIIGDNGGEPWMVSHSNRYDLWWHWDKKTIGAISNMKYYVFVPTGGPNGLKKKLGRLRNENPLIINKFNE